MAIVLFPYPFFGEIVGGFYSRDTSGGVKRKSVAALDDTTCIPYLIEPPNYLMLKSLDLIL